MIKDKHIPVMVNEILSFINNKKNLSILDCTFGGGGHTKKFLESGHFVTAIDQDDNSMVIAKKLKQNFSNIFFDLKLTPLSFKTSINSKLVLIFLIDL